MTPKVIIEKCSGLSIYQQRYSADNYHELVFYNKDLNEWNKIFVDFFGPVKKSPGSKPTEDDLELTKDYGGITENQTLFKKEFGDVSIMAMLWPWQDGVHTTLKIVVSRKK